MTKQMQEDKVGGTDEYHGRLAHDRGTPRFRSVCRPNQHERSVPDVEAEERSAPVVSTGIPVDDVAYHIHGRDAHDTLEQPLEVSGVHSFRKSNNRLVIRVSSLIRHSNFAVKA
jgi:hypothetical protein